MSCRRKLYRSVSLLASFLLLLVGGLVLVTEQIEAIPFKEWADAVKGSAWPRKTEEARSGTGKEKNMKLLPADAEKVAEQFVRVVNDENAHLSEQSQTANWVGGKKDAPFAQKIEVNNKSQIIFHGDLHGDVHSPVALIEFFNHVGIMDGFSIKPEYKKSFYIVFLGDYVNQGWYSPEAMYTLRMLKNENPDNVFLLCGNNDTANINTFPTVLYISVPAVAGHKNIIQCNHGFLDESFLPDQLLNAASKQAFQNIGDKGDNFIYEHVGPNNVAKKQRLENFFDKYKGTDNKFKALFRAHSHSTRPMPLANIMIKDLPEGLENRGIARMWKPIGFHDIHQLWPGIVSTLNISPLSYTGPAWPYWYDTFVVLTLAKKFEDWRMYAIHTEPTELKDKTKRFPDTQKYKNAIKHYHAQKAQKFGITQLEQLSYALEELSAKKIPEA